MKIAYLPWLPHFPIRDGANQRSALLLEALRNIGEVTVYRFSLDTLTKQETADPGISIQTTRPRDRLPLGMGKLLPAKFADSLARNIISRSSEYEADPLVEQSLSRSELERYDVIVCRYTKAMSCLPRHLATPIYLDIDDLDTRVLEGRATCDYLPWIERCLYRRQLGQIRNVVNKTWIQAAAVSVANPNDIARLPKQVQSMATPLPNIPFANEVTPSTVASRLNILCVSSWGNKGNEIGLRQFLETSWPTIIHEFPNATLTLCGGGIDAKTTIELNSIAGVHCKGFVSDLGSEYRNALFCIAPVAFGAGSNIKVLEAAQHGRVCVTTTTAFEAFREHFKEEVSILRSDNFPAFSSSCLSLLRDPDRAIQMGMAAEKTQQSHYTREAFETAVKRCVDDAMHARSQPGEYLASESSPSPHVSIITACLNPGNTLTECLHSVAHQTYPSIEHIVIDGGSSDGSIDTLQGAERPRFTWISESDRGIADAMNKGIERARGKWILFLHADDALSSQTAIEDAVTLLEPEVDINSFAVEIRNATNSRLWLPSKRASRYWRKTPFPHQGALIQRSAFERFGNHDPEFAISMDYDWFARALDRGATFQTFDRVLSVMSDGGISARQDWASLRIRFREERRVHDQRRCGVIKRSVYRVYWSLYLPYRLIRYIFAKKTS